MENYGYFKVACITPAVQIADVKANRKTMQKLLHSLPPRCTPCRVSRIVAVRLYLSGSAVSKSSAG